MIQKQPQQPDVEGNSRDGLGDASLPDAGNSTGYSPDGSLGDCDPACLTKGYHDVKIAGGLSDQREGDELGYAPVQSGGGVVGRSGGWER